MASANTPHGSPNNPVDMKIAVIRQECSYRKGGAERYAANLCRELAEMGHEVWVIAETFDPGIHSALKHVPVKVSHATSATRSRSFYENSQRALRGLNVDAVLALSRSFPSDAFRVSDPLHRYWMKVRYPNPLRRWIENINPRHRAILRLENSIFDPANTRMILTNSKLSKTLIRDYYDYPQELIHVVYNGVDLQHFWPAKTKADRKSKRLLFVGQDFKRKGLAAAIDALALLPDCCLRVVGRDEPASYRKQAHQLGVADRVEFQGSSGDIREIYQDADLFVFPTLYDPFANVCLEALACGLPVLTTTTNGAAEIITEEANGYVIDSKAPDPARQITAKVEIFLKHDFAAREKMRGAARQTAERHTIRANAERIVKLLAQKGGAHE
jgi:UDP-glucose:(heptosyl)LPS alpha-1,3-glucosyltransferase